MHHFTIHPSSFITSSHHHITTSSHHPTSNFQHAKNLRETHHHIITSPHHPSSLIQLPACKKSAKICEKLIITSPHHPIIQLPTSSMQKICENLRETHHHITTSSHHLIRFHLRFLIHKILRSKTWN